MITTKAKAETLHRLHTAEDPLVLYNIWSAGSAMAAKDAGAVAIGTASWAVAADQGYSDGEVIPLEYCLNNLERIVKSVELPVTFDFESGYSSNADELKIATKKIIEIGAAGINFEDQKIGGNGLYDIPEQCARIRAIREAADESGVPLFINLRTDVFFHGDFAHHSEGMVGEAIERAKAYAKAGADGLFVPGLRELTLIKQLCNNSTLPVNIMMLPGVPKQKDLVSVGVSRISYGPTPYCQLMEAFKSQAESFLNI